MFIQEIINISSMGQLDQFHKHRWPKPDYWQRNPKKQHQTDIKPYIIEDPNDALKLDPIN